MSGILLVFPVPRTRLFSVKNRKKLLAINPNSLDNKGSCWILKDFYCSVTMLRELGLINNVFVNETKPGHPDKRLFHLHFRELNG